MKNIFTILVFTLISSATFSQTYQVGLNNELGGYVLYVTPNGQHGLVVTTQDQDISSWYGAPDNVNDPGYHNDAGKQFTDWRLPTTYELELIYKHREAIGGFEYDFYWSSMAWDQENGWGLDFTTGYRKESPKGSSMHGSLGVRAVRSF